MSVLVLEPRVDLFLYWKCRKISLAVKANCVFLSFLLLLFLASLPIAGGCFIEYFLFYEYFKEPLSAGSI